jgi:hypothetical protein
MVSGKQPRRRCGNQERRRPADPFADPFAERTLGQRDLERLGHQSASAVSTPAIARIRSKKQFSAKRSAYAQIAAAFHVRSRKRRKASATATDVGDSKNIPVSPSSTVPRNQPHHKTADDPMKLAVSSGVSREGSTRTTTTRPSCYFGPSHPVIGAS